MEKLKQFSAISISQARPRRREYSRLAPLFGPRSLQLWLAWERAQRPPRTPISPLARNESIVPLWLAHAQAFSRREFEFNELHFTTVCLLLPLDLDKYFGKAEVEQNKGV